MTRRRTVLSLLLALGGGVFVVAGVAFARAVTRRRQAALAAGAAPPPVVPAPPAEPDEWVQMPPGSVPHVEPPPMTPAEHVVPKARDAEDVVDRLVPDVRRPSRWRRFLDVFLAVLILALAAAAVLAIVRVG